MPTLSSRDDSGGITHLVLFLLVSVVAGVLAAGLALPFVGGLGYVARTSTDHFEGLPSELETPPLPERSRVIAADGSTLATFFSENRVLVPVEKMAPVMRQATVAIEDSRFYEHRGLDLKGTMRALLANTQAGTVQQGGSTLTQQYVKNVLVESARTKEELAAAREQSVSRKLRELRYAIGVEQALTKTQILGRYLNIAYFGSGSYGVESAARHYFSKHASNLDLHEAALLAGIVRAPGAYDPTRYPEDARARRDLVLDRMAQLGQITREQADEAKGRGLGLQVTDLGNGCSGSYASFFCDYVTSVIENSPAFGETKAARRELLYRGGLRIQTTLRPKVQQAAQRAVWEYMDKGDDVGGAIAMVEPGTGHIRAMAQNRLYGSGKGRTFINYSVQRRFGGSAGFQAGSTFKPFVLAAALDQGMPLALRMSAPAPLTVDGFEDCQGNALPPYENVRNYDGNSYGSLDMRTATWRSVNTYYVQLEQRTGVCDAVDIARSMGVRRATGEKLPYYQSFVLGGGGEVTPLAMSEAYATFAARGKHCDSIAITKVTDREGNKLDIPRPDCQQVLPRKVADAVNDVLSGVIDGPDPNRTGAAMSLGRPAAGKTGTTNNTVAVWFAGYTPEMSAAVWVGHPKGSVPLDNRTVGGTFYSSLCGGCLPGPLWQSAMSDALSGVPASDFAEVAPVFTRGDPVEVPFVRGLSLSDARERLAEAGLQPTVAEVDVNSGLPAGQVVNTSPSAGASVPPETTVQILLSNGEAAPREEDPPERETREPREPRGPPDRPRRPPRPIEPDRPAGNGPLFGDIGTGSDGSSGTGDTASDDEPGGTTGPSPSQGPSSSPSPAGSPTSAEE